MLKKILKSVSILYVIIVIILFLSTNFSNLKVFFWKSANEIDVFEKQVHIWSKAAIGKYLWSHILNGSLEIINNGFYQNGNITLYGIVFTFLSGPGYIQTTLPQNVRYLILVLNGRTLHNSSKSREWLDYLLHLPNLRKLAVVLLGNENCEDEWIVKYLKSSGGIIDVLFIVYDSPLVDNKEVYQWPLGVATYRGFPNFYHFPEKSRQYVCNFIGTVYKNSSREKLVKSLSKSDLMRKCYIKARDEWVPKETDESLNKYINILSRSLLTLSPAGKNPECYRLYEAISLGSIPVVVTEPPQGKCVHPPLRLLLQYNAPIIKCNTWDEAFQSLNKSSELNLPVTSGQLINWYSSFRKQLALHFVRIIEKKFDLN